MKPSVKCWLLLLLLGLVRTSESLRWGSGGPWIAQDGDVTFTLRYDVTPDQGEEITFVTWYKVRDAKTKILVAASSMGTFGEGTDYKDRVSLGDHHGNLVLHNITLQDTGEFQCVVGLKGKEDKGPSIESRVLYVRGAPEQPTIRQIGRAVENTMLTLNCTTTSTSLPLDPEVTFTYKWFVNDTLMEGPSRDSLTFNASRSDSGNYSCLAVENAERGMTSSTSDDLYVDVLYLPQINVEQSDPSPPFEVVAGQAMTLNCNVITSNPPVSEDGYTWDYLPSSAAFVVRLPARGSSLTVDHVTRERQGWYRCQAANEAGSSMASLHVHVMYTPVLHIEPRPTTRALQILEGNFLTLTCNVTEAEPPVPADGFTWSYLPSDDDVEILLSGNESKVIVGPMTRGLSGRYSCDARNDFHTHSFILPGLTSVQVSVVFSPTVRIESEGFRHSPYRVPSGHSMNLTCRVLSANPPVPINGYRWSYLMQNGQEVDLPGAGAGAVLNLGHVTRLTSGLYRCQAKNDADLDLIIPLGSDTVEVDVMYLEHISASSDVEAQEGDVINLHCNVDSHPTARMTWSVDGRPLRHVASNSDSYVIARATCSDNGEYVCDVMNNEIPGKLLSATTTVRIHCPPEEAGSKANESTILASVGETVRFSVAVVAFPPPTFKWYSPTHTGPLKDDIESNHTFAALTLRNLKVTDSGTYTVNVTNIHGTLTRHFLLLVDVSGGPTQSPLGGKEEPDSPHSTYMTVLLVLAFVGWAATVIAFLVYWMLRHRGQKKRTPSTRAEEEAELDLVSDSCYGTPTPTPTVRQGKVVLTQGDDGTLCSHKSSESDYGSGESQSFI